MAQSRGRSVEVRGVLVDGAVSVGIVAANGAELVASDIVVRHVMPDTPMTGHGIGVIFGSTATLSRIVVDDATDASVVGAGSGTHVSLADAALHDTRPDPMVQVGHALLAFDGAVVEASRCAIERMRRVAVLGANAGTRIAVSDSVISDTLPATPGGSEGRGISCDTGATCEIRSVHVAGGRHVGVRVGGTGTSARLTDVVVSGVLADESSGVGGYGVSVDHGATLTMDRAWLDANHDTGFLLTEADTTATVSDVTIRATEPVGPDLGFGRGIDVERGPSLTAARVRLDANHNLGVFVQGPDATATFDDLEVTDTRVRGDGQFGRGLHAQEGATVTVRRGRFAANHEVGITAADPGTSVTLADVEVVGTLPNGDDAFGRGVEAAAGSQIVGTRIVARANHDVGVCVFDDGSSLRLADVVVVATEGLGCTACAQEGTGAGAYRGGALELRRFVVADSAVVGLQLAEDGQMDLHDGEIARQPVGLNLQVAPYDLARLMDGVRFVDNERTLDSDTLPVPSPAVTLP